MTIGLGDGKARIVSNQCGGYEIHRRYIDKKTGLPKHNKRGEEIWRFWAYMPTLKQLLMVATEEHELVTDRNLKDCEEIIATLKEISDGYVAALREAGLE